MNLDPPCFDKNHQIVHRVLERGNCMELQDAFESASPF